MRVIPCIVIDGVLTASESIPETAISVVCDGINYTVYESVDELPVGTSDE